MFIWWIIVASRILLSLSSILTEPICWCSAQVYRMQSRLLPGEFDFAPTKTTEICQRVIRGVGAVLAAPAAGALALLAKPLRYLGFQLQQNGFTPVRGNAQEKPVPKDGRYSVKTWNVLGVGGGMPRDHGGGVDWRDRLDGIVEKICEAHPDFLTLNEIYDEALGRALIERLKDRYAHFGYNMGAATWGVTSGIFFASKFPVQHASFTPFSTNANFDAQKGYFSCEIQTSPRSVTRIIATHLMYDVKPETYERDSTTRMFQIAEIVNHVAKKQLVIIPQKMTRENIEGPLMDGLKELEETKNLPPTIILGDLNIDRDSPEGKQVLRFLDHGYLDPRPTRTNQFLRILWDPSEPYIEETIDYISGVKNTGVQFLRVDLIPADDGKDTHSVLSDHHGVLATIQSE
jgi:endonuclease/exonuclease/phosphatase family metal-dependent hydrolase